jgi:hypothetical protein
MIRLGELAGHRLAYERHRHDDDDRRDTGDQ